MFATTGVGVPCPFLALTGWQCPLCGGTRMGGALLHGDLAAAFAFNPLALVAGWPCSESCWPWSGTIEIARRSRPPGRPGGRSPDGWQRVPAVAWLLRRAAAARCVYTVLRNLR